VHAGKIGLSSQQSKHNGALTTSALEEAWLRANAKQASGFD